LLRSVWVSNGWLGRLKTKASNISC